MNKYEIVQRIEKFAPLDTQEKWDASGWISDNEKKEVNKILFALTITDKIYSQAVDNDCDMIISHHPLFYVPFEYKNINMYCAHTNLDKANGGTTDILLKELGLCGQPFGDFVRVVDFEERIHINEFKEKLYRISPNLRYVNNYELKSFKKAGFCAGSGSEFISEAPCEVYITGDIKFHTAIETTKVLFDIGHFESEIFAVKLLKELSGVNEKGIIADEKSPFI
ncbi:MAG: Nif3-like dinuclear metal center hexameric protein [bacterium]|nr:Nif3-like dinuclear metal center hexameric protein [bacterium]